MPIIEFQSLPCPRCEGELFTRMLVLKHRPGGGLVEEQRGWLCVRCHQQMDAVAALRAQDVRAKKAELAQLERELGEQYAAESAGQVSGQDDQHGKEDPAGVHQEQPGT